MSHRLLLLLLLLLGPAAGWAQDLLTRQNGEEIKVNVLEITPAYVSYRRFDNPDGPLITVRKADVFMIRYANGTKEVFGTTPPAWRQDAAASYPPPRPAVPGAAPGSLPDPVPGDEVRPEEAVALNGPRIGITLLAGGVADKARDEYHVNPFLTQFGWQFETRLFRLPSGTAGLFEFVPLIGGLEQGKFLPSLNALFGIRGPKGLEFGVGPNVTPLGTNIALTLGTSFQSSGINFPVNLAVVPGNGGARISLLVGFNTRRR